MSSFLFSKWGTQVKSHSSKDNAIPNRVRYGAHAWKLNNNGIYQRALKIKTWSQFQHSLQPMKAFGSLNIKFMCIDIMLCPGYILPLSSLPCSMGFFIHYHLYHFNITKSKLFNVFLPNAAKGECDEIIDAGPTNFSFHYFVQFTHCSIPSLFPLIQYTSI